jgi:hypothetical protein
MQDGSAECAFTQKQRENMATIVNSPRKIAEDDYDATIRFWAANPQVVPLPPGAKIPHFSRKKFNSHAEMNAWKEELIRQMAANPRG